MLVNSFYGSSLGKAALNAAQLTQQRVQGMIGSTPTYNRDYTPLYLDTGGALSFDDFSSQRTFKQTMYPAVLSTGYPDEDVMLLMNDGIHFHQDAWQNFDRFYSVYLNNDEVETRQYVFFVRPGLYLVDEDGSSNGVARFTLSKESRTYYDGFMRFMKHDHEVIMRSLTEEFGRGDMNQSAVSGSGLGQAKYGGQLTDDRGNPLAEHSLIPWLQGRTESLQIPDYQIKNFALIQPYTKYSMPYATSAIESTTGNTFECTFKEDSQLRVHKFFYTWLYYMDGVMRNRFKPKEKYILYNAFDYATSVYHIVCDVTGENIIWWSKYTGVFPTSVPNSDLSWNKGGKTDNKLTVPFVAFHHEALNPQIFTDFNYNSLGYTYMRNVVEPSGGRIYLSKSTAPIFDTEHGIMGPTLVGRPYIVTSGSGFAPKLRWMVASKKEQLILT